MIKGRILTVTQEDGEPIIKIKGSELFNFGFKSGDILRVNYENEKITLHKTPETRKIEAMQSRNPSLLQLINEFGLDINPDNFTGVEI